MLRLKFISGYRVSAQHRGSLAKYASINIPRVRNRLSRRVTYFSVLALVFSISRKSDWRNRAPIRQHVNKQTRTANVHRAYVISVNFEISEILACYSRVSRKKEVAGLPELETSFIHHSLGIRPMS